MKVSSAYKWTKILTILFINWIAFNCTVNDCYSGSYCCECSILCFNYEAENSIEADQKCMEYIMSSGLIDACFIEMYEGNYVCSPGPFGIEKCSYGAIDTCPSEIIYGKHSEQTEILRYFRDDVLSKTSEGRELIKLYYQWSPAIVKAMEGDQKFKEWVEETIDGVLLILAREMD